MTCASCGFDNPEGMRFCGQCGAALGAPRPSAPAERRILSVMFCDLVASTALSASLDPEDFHALLQLCHGTWRQIVEGHGGHVAQFLGDGLLAYFGYPQSREDDGARALRAGLRIVAATAAANAEARLPPPLALEVRVGIHSGSVVVGEIGRGSRRENLALGTTPNLAARLQSLAEPGTVYISATTYRLVRGAFVCQSLGPQRLKGFAQPMEVYRVEREGPPLSLTGGVSTLPAALPMVGRDKELALLRDHWRRAQAGEGQTVLIQGEAGIGKSLLVQQLAYHVAPASAVLLEGRCSPYYQNTAFYPVIELLERLLGVEPGAASPLRLAQVEETLKTWGLDPAPHAPLWAGLLSIPLESGAPPDLPPAQLRKQLIASLVDAFSDLARRQPLVLVFQDLHWIDPSTVDLLSELAQRCAAEPMLLLLTARPEFVPPWPAGPHRARIELQRLPRSELAQLIRRTAAGAELTPEVVERLAARAEGVPLFAEELTKMVVETGVSLEPDAPAGASLVVPTTLQSSIEARLDRQGEAKATAQMAAVVGQEVEIDLLRALHPGREDEVERHVDLLVEAEILVWIGAVTCAFRHALIRDAVYESVLKKVRPVHHRAVAEALEAGFPVLVDSRPELLAYHCAAGDLAERAILYWRQAAQRAADRGANQEASRHLGQALALLAELPEGRERDEVELSLRTLLGSTLMALRGFGAPEVEAVYRRAFELCTRLQPTPHQFPVLAGLARIYSVRADLAVARNLGEELVRTAEAAGEPAHQIVAHLNLGITLFHLAEHAQARSHLARAIDLLATAGPVPHALRYGTQPELHSRAYLSFVLWHLGFPDQALSRSEEALSRAGRSADPLSLCIALSAVGLIRQCRGEPEETERVASTCIQLAQEAGLPLFLALARLLRGWGLARRGARPDPAAVEEVHRGMLDWTALGTGVAQTQFLAALAELHSELGRPEEADACISRAEDLVQRTGEQYFVAELHRLRGELLAARGDGPEAERWLRRACQVARAQGTRSLELRALTGLARLWKAAGRAPLALRLLSRALGGFTEGFATADLRAARSLVAELHAGVQR